MQTHRFSTKDQDGQDSKIIAALIANIDPNFSSINDIDDMQENKIAQLKHFIEHRKDLEVGKYVKIEGLEGKEMAKKKISKAIAKNKVNDSSS